MYPFQFSSRAITLILSAFAIAAPLAAANSYLGPTEGHVNFYKHSAPSDDSYTSSPSSSTIAFLGSNWTRLTTFATYWDQNTKLSWYSRAWAYLDSYAIYTDPSDSFFAPVVRQHPEWILRDVNGNPLFINYACAGGTCPQYAANITDPNGFRAWWIREALGLFNRTPAYKGLFIDDVNLDLQCVSNGNGIPTTPVDPATGQLMTNDAWRTYLADFMAQVRAALPAIEIVHNSIWFLDWSDPNIQREIQAADWINLERGVNDNGLRGGWEYWSYNRFLTFIDFLHTNGKGVILDAEAPTSDTNPAREYSVASYLLISNGKDLVGDSSQTPSYWWSGFNSDLGSAASGRYIWQDLWRRDFQGGMALVNPPDAAPVTVTLPAAFTRVDGSIANSITLNAGEGAVLKSQAVATQQAAPPGPGPSAPKAYTPPSQHPNRPRP